MAQKPNANINHRNTVAKKGNTFRVTLHIDDDTNQPLILGRCELQPLGVFAATNMNGDAVFTDVPAGEWTLRVTYVGMEPLVKLANDYGTHIMMSRNSSWHSHHSPSMRLS